jgi:hypothetical protein
MLDEWSLGWRVASLLVEHRNLQRDKAVKVHSVRWLLRTLQRAKLGNDLKEKGRIKVFISLSPRERRLDIYCSSNFSIPGRREH